MQATNDHDDADDTILPHRDSVPAHLSTLDRALPLSLALVALLRRSGPKLVATCVTTPGWWQR